MTPLEAEVKKAARLARLIEEVRQGKNDADGRVQEQLHQGDTEAALLALIGATERALQRRLLLTVPKTAWELIRLGLVLGSFLDLRALTTLARLAAYGHLLPLERALDRWKRAGDLPYAQALLHLLNVTVPTTLRHQLALRESPVPYARELVALAERNPLPELRAALPLLEFGLGRPRAFRNLQARLQKALGVENLPIPATPQPTQDLPIPTEKEEVTSR